jgi:hypothetical protein
MKRCTLEDNYLRYVEACGEGQHSEEEMREHLRECELCRREVEQLSAALASAVTHSFDEERGTPHLTDLDLATFAAHGLDAPNADEAVAHLARCRPCRMQFRHIRRLMEQHEELIHGYPARRPVATAPFLQQVRLILRHPLRALRAMAAFTCWIAEWITLVVVVFQLALHFLAHPDAITPSPGTQFLGIRPFEPLRFWLIAALCTVMAILFRWLGAQLYHSSVEQEWD